MRIDLIITELRVGGAERCLTELALGLVKNEDQVRVISIAPLPAPGSRNALVERLNEAGIQPLSLDCPSGLSGFRAIGKLTQLLREDPPDVVQSFLYHANVIAGFATKRAKSKVHVGGVRVAEKRPLRLWLERRVLQRMRGVTCVSQSVADFVKQELRPKPSCFVRVIHNGLDVARFENATPMDRSEWGFSPAQRLLLVLGRFHPQKGIDWLLQQAPTILAEIPEAALLFVGEGPLRSSVERTCAGLPSGRCKVLPWEKRVPELLKAADALLLPSRYEGLPNVVLEAMGAGLPVVAAKVEGVAELLGPQTAPQTFAWGNAGEFLTRLKQILSDRELRSQVIASNRLRARDEFSVTRMVKDYRDFYYGLHGMYRRD